MRALAAVLLAAAIGGAAAVSRPTIAAMEKAFDKRLERDVVEHPYDLLGMTRGVYLEGYGAVFTAEVALATAPGISPFNPRPTKPQIEALRKKKLDRLPALRRTMREMLVDAASSLDTVPAGEQLVLAISLFSHAWEDTSGMPSQVVMRAQRKSLLAFKTGGAGAAALEAAVRTEEF